MMTNSLATLPIQQLKRAVGIREQIESLTRELHELLAGPSFASAPVSGGRRGLSAAGRARIAAAQRARWSRYNAARGIRPRPASNKQRLSAQGRAKVSAAVRARWVRFRAAKAAAANGHAR